MAPWIVATLALLSTAGMARRAARVRRIAPRKFDAGPGRYTSALETLVGGRLAGMMLLVFRARSTVRRRVTPRLA